MTLKIHLKNWQIFGIGLCFFSIAQLPFLQAQNANFSQFHLAPAQTNPAMIGTSNQIQTIFNYRRQFIGSGVSFETPMVSFSMPFFNQNQQRKGAIGLSFMQDRTGEGGILINTGGFLTGVYNFSLNSESSPSRIYLGVGAQGAFLQKRIDVLALQTGSQWDGSVFDPGLPVDYNFDFNSKFFISANAGLMLYVQDTCDNVKSFLSLSVRNINQPNVSFISDSPVKTPTHFTIAAGYSVIDNDRLQIQPSMRYIREGNAQEIRAGLMGYYKLGGDNSRMIGVGAWYDSNSAVAIALEVQQPKYMIGFSYDLGASAPINSLGAAAMEFTVGIKFGKKCRQKVVEEDDEIILDTTVVEKKFDTGDSLYTLVAKLRKSDSTVLSVDTAKVEFRETAVVTDLMIPTEDDLKLLKRVAYFFYLSDDVNQTSAALLEDIVAFMKKFKGVEIEIDGHTCNIGATEEDNQILSVRRAEAVRKFLTSRGISEKRLKVAGQGSSKPVLPNKTEYGRIKNRRVEFTLLTTGADKSKGNE